MAPQTNLGPELFPGPLESLRPSARTMQRGVLDIAGIPGLLAGLLAIQQYLYSAALQFLYSIVVSQIHPYAGPCNNEALVLKKACGSCHV